MEQGEPDYSRIVRVLSHPVAMAQCQSFLRAHLPHAELEHVSSTAEAVRIVADNPGRGWAAIGLTLAAAHYGLDVLRERVTDHDNNVIQLRRRRPGRHADGAFHANTSIIRDAAVVISSSPAALVGISHEKIEFVRHPVWSE